MELRHPCLSVTSSALSISAQPSSLRHRNARHSSAVMRIMRYGVGVSLAVIGSASVYAEEDYRRTDKTSSSSLETLPSVTVTAVEDTQGRASEGYRADRVSGIGPWQGRSAQDTPYSITVFSEELMTNLQSISADQVFRINPTMQQLRAQYENNQPAANLRGFRVTGPHRDGVADDRYGHASTIEDTERIEVLNGLSGFLYGAGNVGGLVNYVTKQSTEERLNKITLASRGHQSWYAHGDLSGKFDAEGRFGYRLNLAKQDGSTPIKGQVTKRDFYSLILDARPRRDVYLHLSASRHQYEDQGAQATWAANASTRPSADALRNDRSYSPAWTHRSYEINRYTGHAKWDVNEVLGLRANLLFSDGSRSSAGSQTTNTLLSPSTYTQSFSRLYAPGVVNTLSYQDDKRGAFYADFKFDTRGINHKLTVGLQYSNTSQDRWSRNAPIVRGGTFPIHTTEGSPKPDVAPISRGTKSVWHANIMRNLVLGDDISLGERWSVLTGMAHTNISSRSYDKSAITPTVALLYKPVPQLSTYISYMESLEQGGVAADEYQGAVVANKGEVFKPLTSKQIEIGAKYDWGGVLLSGAVFQIDKALQYYDLRNPLSPMYVQDGRQVHQGAEFTAIGKLTTRLNLIGGFTWLNAKIKKQRQDPSLEGKRPALVADKLLKLRTEYAFSQMPGLSVSGGFSTTSASWANAQNTDRLPGYAVYDLGLRYRMNPATAPLTLMVDLLNVTNKHYWGNESALGDPRTLLVSLNYSF